jgi:hypothetical protein
LCFSPKFIPSKRPQTQNEKNKIVTSNGLTKHNEKEKMTKNKKNKAQMKCSIAMLMDKRNNLSLKPKDYSGFGIL